MSLKAIKEALDYFEQNHCSTDCQSGEAADRATARITRANAAISALEKAAKDLTRLHLSDGADAVAHRDHVIAAMTDDPASQWNHPDVVAWSEAAQLLATIAKEAE